MSDDDVMFTENPPSMWVKIEVLNAALQERDGARERLAVAERECTEAKRILSLAVGRSEQTLAYVIDQLRTENAHLRDLLRECGTLLWHHHEQSLTTWIGTCPVCAKTGERFVDDIFTRIQAALVGKP